MDMIEKQTDTVGIARNAFLAKEAEFEAFEAAFQPLSIDEPENQRKRRAKATAEWSDLRKELARAKSVYEFRKDELSVMNKEYQAQYLELKDHEGFLKKQGRGA